MRPGIFIFEDPYILLLLIPVLALLIYLRKKSKQRRITITVTPLARAKPGGILLKFRNIPFYFYGISAILACIALARPQSGNIRREIKVSGIDIMLILDASGSMKALDFQEEGKRKTRFDVAKNVLSNFIMKREGDRIGLIVFGEYSFTQCPLTVDYEIIKAFLDQLTVGIAGDSTALGDALGLAVKRLKDIPSRSKIAILLTDGRNNTGMLSPFEAAQLAKTYGIKVYTVGIGTEGRSPFLVDTFFGKRLVYQYVELDEQTLKKIATETGGRYFRAKTSKQLEEIYDTIDKLEKTERKVKEFAEFNELYRFFLIPSFLFLIAGFVLSGTLFRRYP